MEAFTLITPSEGEVLSQHTPLQANFKAMRARLSASQGKVDYLYLKPTELEDDSTPRILTFAWENAREDFCPQCVEVAENPIFTGHVMHFAVLPGRQETRGHSLKTNTKYYWRVAGIDETDSPVCSQTASFQTAAEFPRWVFIEGVPNVRDIGGWETKDGHRVKQGLVYRGGEMNSHQTATPAGLKFAEEELTIRTDLDIRGHSELNAIPSHGPALPPSVKWFNVPLAAYADINTDEQRANYAKAFRILITPAYFPIYTHCWGGADRTGTLVFLLNAALGVQDEALLLDYELTGLATWGARSRDSELFRAFEAMLEKLAPGQDYQAKAIAYWKSAGISDAEIIRLQNLFLE